MVCECGKRKQIFLPSNGALCLYLYGWTSLIRYFTTYLSICYFLHCLVLGVKKEKVMGPASTPFYSVFSSTIPATATRRSSVLLRRRRRLLPSLSTSFAFSSLSLYSEKMQSKFVEAIWRGSFLQKNIL